LNTKRRCLFCGNPTYSVKRWYCSKKCKAKMKRIRNKQKSYFNDKNGKWEQLNE
jgi:predicted nucleic acid-binding Zn ribbon protein